MSQDMEVILRKSLDEVDRIQKRQIVGGAIFLLAFLLQAFSLYSTLRRVGADVASGLVPARAFMVLGISLMVFTVAFCTFGITFFISRMTKKILKAIELLALR